MRKLMAVLAPVILMLLVAGGLAFVPTASAASSFSATIDSNNVNVRSAPSLSAPVVEQLQQGQQIAVVNSAQGSSVGGSNLWYQLPSGNWVFSGLVSKGGASAPANVPAGQRWVDVNLTTQTAKAMVGNQVVHTAAVTTGRPGFPTPTGTFTIWRRVANETMDSRTIGIPRSAPNGYYVTNVLYTQYFDNSGDALHFNWWEPSSVFGNTPTSHGCVGMDLADAQYFWNFAGIGTTVVVHY